MMSQPFSRLKSLVLSALLLAGSLPFVAPISSVILATALVALSPSQAQAVAFITPVDVAPGTVDAWTDVDLSVGDKIPVGATGVILHYVNADGTARAVGWRNNGSTDARIQTLAGTGHCWVAVGVDSSRIFEAYVATSVDPIDIFLVGYFTTDAVFFTNGVDKSISATVTWTDADISADTGGDTAIGAIVEAVAASSQRAHGFRKNGSTDNRINTVNNHNAGVWIFGVDGSEIYERYIANVDQDDFLLGYIKSDSTFLTNATDLSQTNTVVYEDLPALPAGALGGFIEVDASATAAYALRKNGSSEDIYRNSQRHAFAIVEADGSRLIEGKIAATTTDCWLVGYPDEVGGGPPPSMRRPSILMMGVGMAQVRESYRRLLRYEVALRRN